MQVKLISWAAWGSLLMKLNGLKKDGAGHILIEVETGTRVAELMEQLGMPENAGWVIVVNDELQTTNYVFQPDDRLSLYIPAGGG